VFDSGAPTSGNLLLAAVNCISTVTTVTSSGWSALDNSNNGGNDMFLFYKIAGASESDTHTFTANASNKISVIAIEVENQSSVWLDQAEWSTDQISGDVTPTVIPTLAISFYGSDDGSSETMNTSGWTIVRQERPSFHATRLAVRDDLTTDTSTTISCSWSTAADELQWIGLIK
jgi:hypothetical protein